MKLSVHDDLSIVCGQYVYFIYNNELLELESFYEVIVFYEPGGIAITLNILFRKI